MLPNKPYKGNQIPNQPFYAPEVPATFDRLFGARVANEQLDPNPSNLGSNGWVRPTDWLPVPEITPSEEKFLGLFAVYDTPENFIAVYFEGDYTVDWGDGSVENFASGEKAQHSYKWSDIPASTVTSSGYRQVLVEVIPQSGQNLTLMDLTVRHDSCPTGDTYVTTPWLDISVSMPEAGTGESLIFASDEFSYLNFYSFLADLQELRIINSGFSTDLFSSYIPLSSLKKLSVNAQSLESLGYLKNFEAMEEVYLEVPNLLFAPFNLDSWERSSLKKLVIGDLLTNSISNFFRGLKALEEAQIGDMPFVTEASSVFYDCTSLKKVTLGQTPSLTNVNGMFERCVSLVEAPFFDTSNLEEFSSCFTYCDSLESIPQYDLSSVTYMYETFYECYSLKNIPPLNLSSLESVSSPFYYCSSLYSFPEISLSESAIDISTFFDRCSSLQQSGLSQVFSDIDYVGCLLGRAALVEIFNNLGEAEATINIEGNYGAADLTAEDLAIATDKGWTVLY